MKRLISFINEGNIKDEDKKLYINYSHKYLEYLNNNNELCEVIKKTFDTDITDVLKIMNDNHISNFLDKKIIPRIVEYYLANKMSNVNGFTFEQSKENSKNKDICCTKINDKILEEDIFKDIDNPLEFFSIELKCSSNPSSITGNKSYAIDNPNNPKKNKQSFYILITYDYSDENNKTNENNKNKNITVKLRNAYFGYIVQNDWIYGNSGNSSSLKINDNEKNNRIIQII